MTFNICDQQPELQKGKTFTPAAFWGPKNLHQKCVIRDKFNATKSAWFATNSILKRLKNIIYIQNCKKHWNYIQSPKYMQYMLLRTKKFTPKLRDSRQSNFLNHPLSRSPPEFLHQLGNFTPATLVPLVRFCISALDKTIFLAMELPLLQRM